MFVNIHPFAVLSLLSAILTWIASFATWRRSGPGSLMLSLLLLSMTMWSGFYSTRWMNISLDSKLFWFNLMYIGVSGLPTLFLLFVLAFTHNDAWLTRRNIFLLSIQPVLSTVLFWTNEYHHLFYQSLDLVQENGFLAIDFVRGPWYWINIVYSYTIIGIAFLVLSQCALRWSPLYLNQYRLILIGSFIPWAASAYSEFYFSQWHGLDLAPLMFGLSAIIYVFAISHTHFMDLIPIARSLLIENMRDGVLVLDLRNRIMDINPAMEGFLEEKISFYMGKNAFEVFQPWMENTDLFLDKTQTRLELKVPKDPSRYVDLQVTPLYDRSQSMNGHLMVFRDITESKQVEKRLRYVNDRLQGQLIEIGLLQSKLREQAIRDPLTNIFNRRYLDETLDRELSRAAREDYPVCVIMVDIDHFKRVNDTHGHEAGDLVLKAMAATLSHHCRRGDFACRYGGEEFVVVLPNITLETAYGRAEDLRKSLNQLSVPYEEHNLSVTISMGIAGFPENGQTRDTLLRAADQAMYAAKEAGRDHILSYNQIRLAEQALED
ncbi:MAG TPA: histidine kinase N-terminal 7TM domain-containing protein [Anaerolineales bacterium]